MFTLDDVPAGNDVIFVATGTGLAPYVSMLRSNYAFHAGHRTVVFHGARHSWDLGYRGDMESLAAHHDNFTYVPTISDPDEETEEWTGLTGRVTAFFEDDTAEMVLGAPLDPARVSVSCAGIPP